MPLLTVENLRTWLAPRGGLPWRAGRRTGAVKAVDGVSFTLEAGRTLGLAGESGSGKSTLARTILRLIPATSGRVIFGGVDVLAASGRQLRGLRRRMQIVFQDPLASLNPALTVERIVGEALSVHGLVGSRRERRQRVARLLERVGLEPQALDRRPHEFSGGQRQRIGIARALALEPELIICDEPVSALDVSVQAQVLNLLMDLQEERGLSYVFIAHNLALMRCCCHEIAVMLAGRIIEHAPTGELLGDPRHPYTRALLSAVPDPQPAGAEPLPVLPGEPPDPADLPRGCAFHPRCPHVQPRCRSETPTLRSLPGQVAHRSACHYAADLPAWSTPQLHRTDPSPSTGS